MTQETVYWDLAPLGHGFIGMKETPDGVYVRRTDHAAEIARLRAELDNAAAAAVANMSLACEKEREADALRVDAMRYRWLRDQAAWTDAKNPCPYSEQEHGQLRCITAGLDEAVDKAMGPHE